MKKFISLFLVLVCVFSLGMSSFAVEQIEHTEVEVNDTFEQANPMDILRDDGNPNPQYFMQGILPFGDSDFYSFQVPKFYTYDPVHGSGYNPWGTTTIYLEYREHRHYLFELYDGEKNLVATSEFKYSSTGREYSMVKLDLLNDLHNGNYYIKVRRPEREFPWITHDDDSYTLYTHIEPYTP